MHPGLARPAKPRRHGTRRFLHATREIEPEVGGEPLHLARHHLLRTRSMDMGQFILRRRLAALGLTVSLAVAGAVCPAAGASAGAPADGPNHRPALASLVEQVSSGPGARLPFLWLTVQATPRGKEDREASASQESPQFRLGGPHASVAFLQHRTVGPELALEGTGAAAEVSRGMAFTLSPPAWPGLTLGAARTERRSAAWLAEGAAEGPLTPLDFSHAVWGRLTYTWRVVTLEAGAATTRGPDDAHHSTSMRLMTANAGITLRLFDGRLTLNPNLSWVVADVRAGREAGPAGTARAAGRTIMGALRAEALIVPEVLRAEIQVSLSGGTWGGPDGADEIAHLSGEPGRRMATAGAMGRLVWHLDKGLGGPAGTTFSLRMEWTRTVAGLSQGDGRGEIGVFLGLNLPAPFLF